MTTPTPAALRVLLDLLKVLPSWPSCDDFHHRSNEDHAMHDPCPPLERYERAVKKAEEVVAALRAAAGGEDATS